MLTILVSLVLVAEVLQVFLLWYLLSAQSAGVSVLEDSRGHAAEGLTLAKRTIYHGPSGPVR